MKVLRSYAALIVLMVVLFACRKDRSFEDPNSLPITNNQWEFKAAGASFGGPMDSAFIRSIGLANSLSLSGPSSDGKGEISLQIISTGSIIKGDYKNPQVLFQYTQNGSLSLQSSLSDDFTVTITAIDSVSVTGLFSGTTLDSAGHKGTVSEGKFTAAISGSNAAPAGKGTLTVWSKQLCGGSGSISVTVGDSTGAITQASAAEPNCGAPGTATFSLPAGTYSVIAVCGTDSIVVDASVLPDVCTTVEADFSQVVNGDYFPLVSRWTYGNTADYENDTLAIESIGDTLIGADTFYKFFNDKTSETSYYRKDNGLYYQYLITAFGQPLTTPVQIIILKDNVPLNTSWESDPYDVDFSSAGLPLTITAKLQSTITNKDYSGFFNGRTYKHLIEVTSKLFTRDAGGNWQDADSGFRMVFAKGVGIVFYQDLNTGSDWQIRNYNVSF